jgi:capsular polysaccharide transport system permease protein
MDEIPDRPITPLTGPQSPAARMAPRGRGGKSWLPERTERPIIPPALGRQLEALLASRRQKLRQFGLRAAIFILLPTALVWFYTAVIATPGYVCTYEITYQSYQPSSTLSSTLIQSSFGTNTADSIDYGTLLYEYIRSSQLAEQIDRQMHLRDYYSSDRIDWFSRLGRDASQAKLLSVEGYDPQFTMQLAQNIEKAADHMMDQLTAGPEAAAVIVATSQLAQANTALQAANNQLTAFRDTHGDFNPDFIAKELGTIIGALESQVANLRAQLIQDQANMQPGASQIVQLKLQIAGLESQIASERQRLAEQTGGTSYSDVVEQYQLLLSNQALATSIEQAAQQGLLVAEADAAQKQNYVVDFVPPYVPDQPTEPTPLIDAFETFLACLGLYGIGNLLFSAFRDQAGV